MIQVIIEEEANFIDLENRINEDLGEITNLIDIKYSTTMYKDTYGSDVIYSAMIIYKEEEEYDS